MRRRWPSFESNPSLVGGSSPPSMWFAFSLIAGEAELAFTGLLGSHLSTSTCHRAALSPLPGSPSLQSAPSHSRESLKNPSSIYWIACCMGCLWRSAGASFSFHPVDSGWLGLAASATSHLTGWDSGFLKHWLHLDSCKVWIIHSQVLLDFVHFGGTACIFHCLRCFCGLCVCNNSLKVYAEIFSSILIFAV